MPILFIVNGTEPSEEISLFDIRAVYYFPKVNFHSAYSFADGLQTLSSPGKLLTCQYQPLKNNVMAKNIPDYLSSQLPERQSVMSRIHEIILKQDKTVIASIEPMMGNEMIVYKAAGVFKYGLSGVKKYMSLHLLPIYGSTSLHAKYQALLQNAAFQKGCINFVHPEDMPLDIVSALITDCAPIDLRKIREDYLKSKSKKK